MKCVVPALNIKVLSRAINLLAKIGDELFIDPQQDGINFRTTNAARTAFGTFKFAPSFFSHYKYDGDTDSNPQFNDVQCKIAMKSCVNIFRSSTMDKFVECIKILFDTDLESLKIQLFCRYGIVKAHYITVIDGESMDATYVKDDMPVVISANARVLSNAIENFQHTLDEITLHIAVNKLTVSTFVENTPNPDKVLRTELCLNSSEFLKYSVKEELSVTFRLKELRNLLSFGESVNLPVTLNIEGSGRPLVMVVKSTSFEANFVLATLTPQGVDAANMSFASSFGMNSLSATRKRKASTSKNRSKTTKKNNTSKRIEPPNNLSQLFSGPSSVGISMSPAPRESQLDFNFMPQEDNIIPTTPPRILSERNRRIFTRCFDATFDPRNLPGYTQVLAYDSAEEAEETQ